MAWDARHPRADAPPSLSWTPSRQNISFDDALNFFPRSNSPASDAIMRSGTLLSPIEEEVGFASKHVPLEVKLMVKFLDPGIRSVYARTYSSSDTFEPTDRLCQGLLRRIDHCCEEFITRKDSDALNAFQGPRQEPKLPRFELCLQIICPHTGLWAQRSFRSYQKQPLIAATAKEVLRSAHRIIGIFLRRHDEGFQWTGEPAPQYFPDKPDTFRPSFDTPPSLLSIPRSRWIESSQTWEFIPGYALELSLRSQNRNRSRPELTTRTVRVLSSQDAPLNLGMGEDLLFHAHKVLDGALDSRKTAFDIEHASCDGFEGSPHCQHFEENALEIELRLVNNLGPIQDHLKRSIRTKLQLFQQLDDQDCSEFLGNIESRFKQLRDRTDATLEMLNDFELRIIEMHGQYWQAKQPARFVINGQQHHSRRSIEAILDRVQTGVADVLRGNGIAIHMTAHKRGHLILDKALVARQNSSSPKVSSGPPDDEKRVFVSRLKDRVQRDLNLITKDTCSLDDIPESPRTESPPMTPCGRPYSARSSPPLSPGSPGLIQRPQIPARTSSAPRVFPLVPAKYRERPESVDTTAHDSGISLESEPGRRSVSPDQAGGQIAAVEKVASAVGQDSIAEKPQVAVVEPVEPVEPVEAPKTPELKRKSAGLLRAGSPMSKATPDRDDNSTRPSTPGLSDDDSPSPGQSMLITPTSPHVLSSGQGPFATDLGLNSMLETPESCTYPGTLDLAPTLSKSTISLRTPPTPPESDAASLSTVASQNLAPSVTEIAISDSVETPHVTVSETAPESSCVEKDLEGFLEHSASEVEVSSASAEEHHVVGEEGGPTPVQKRSASEEIEGFLEHSCCEHDELSPPVEDQQVVEEEDETTPVQEAIRPPTEIAPEGPVTQGPRNEPSLDDQSPSKLASIEVESNEEPQTASRDTLESLESLASKSECPHEKILPIGPETPERVSKEVIGKLLFSGGEEKQGDAVTVLEPEDSCLDYGKLRPLEDGMSRSKVDFFEDEEAETELRTLPPVPDLPVENFTSVPASATPVDLAPDSQHFAPSQADVREPKQSTELIGEDIQPVDVESSQKGPPHSIVEEAPLPSPVAEASTDPMAREEAEAGPSGSALDATSSRKPDLLPPLPIQPTTDSSSSVWEDDVSDDRASRDSVDSVKTEEEKPASPSEQKRLGTPTAGLLGLSEARWADFGIRSALTGTHRFDRPSTAPLLGSSGSSHHNNAGEEFELRDDLGEHGEADAEALKPPRKSHHLPHKKSKSSLFRGARFPMLSRKEKKKEAKDDSQLGLPRAMMLFAGLAIASQVAQKSS